ncbi:uncharacterized protein F5147DRAFT_680821 [Suillus discolor]|uniref:F-box domain-containing protein n=1 Tax=Suillus discolor TaxID=1912936 RepID=A0A9P7JWW8_9AGAM|nr:uncharacterized protein F5147DRAFT_680821 [Suillus discolor]KAG2113408.1 hypothetical protein F5147DRAFT_680821 [Suillus discolor]
MSVMQPHRVLFIPELLGIILSFVDEDDHVNNACVCKQWSEIALDIIWKEVDGLSRLLTLLRPYTITGRYNFFDGLPDSRDWTRFQRYANRVRILRFQQDRDIDYSGLLDDMARTRTTLDMLPNLHTLEWIYEDVECMERATLFMHQRLRRLVISAPPVRHKDKVSFFLDVCVRAPHLHSLDLRVPYRVQHIETAILELLRGLPDLKTIILPEFFLTSSIVSELSRMKHINIVQFEYGREQGFGEEKDVDIFAPVLEEGAFPALWDLAVTARIEHVMRFMNADFAPINLTSLYINTYVEHEPEELHTLLVMLSERCRGLSELYILLAHYVAGESELVPAKQITFNTLAPLLSFPNLSTFQVMHKYPVNITLEEIEELACRWPSLESLTLNEEPLIMHDFTLDLRALIPFALHCPKLRRLGLFIDANPSNISPTLELKPFAALCFLSVGTSRAQDPEAVAAFLSHLCPPKCKLEVGVTWTSFGVRSCRLLDDYLRVEITKRFHPWKSARDILPILIQLRREEREKSRALQEEVEDLRTRTRLLMDKTDIKANDSCIVT